MARRNQEEIKLSEKQIERIVDDLWDKLVCSNEGKSLLDEKIDTMAKNLDFLITKRLMRKIRFAEEDQAKLYAVAEIMKANFYEKLKKLEDDDNEI